MMNETMILQKYSIKILLQSSDFKFINLFIVGYDLEFMMLTNNHDLNVKFFW